MQQVPKAERTQDCGALFFFWCFLCFCFFFPRLTLFPTGNQAFFHSHPIQQDKIQIHNTTIRLPGQLLSGLFCHARRSPEQNLQVQVQHYNRKIINCTTTRKPESCWNSPKKRNPPLFPLGRQNTAVQDFPESCLRLA